MLKDTDAKTYSPLVLAYIGDAVYQMLIRSIIVKRGNMPVNKMHQLAKSYVKASAQAAIIRRIEGSLTDEELSVFKRGRNAKQTTMAKNASLLEYKAATGLEALFGYLYLKKEYNRMIYLLKEGLKDEKE